MTGLNPLSTMHLGVILTGGRSRRFGSPKALARIGERTIIERVAAAHGEVFERVVLAGALNESLRSLGLPFVEDVFRGVGPLGGVHAALMEAAKIQAAGICVSPCDAPFVHPGALRALIDASEGLHAVVPYRRSRDRIEPLFGWYAAATCSTAEECIRKGELAMRSFVGRIRSVRLIEARRLAPAADPDRLFLNVNTEADLTLARRAFERGDRDER